MSQKIVVLTTLTVAIAVFAVGSWWHTQSGAPSEMIEANINTLEQTELSDEKSEILETVLVRPYSPIMGPADAPVTIVEFFDPACEACRAFYPVVKSIMTEFPNDVRVVLRYTPFHGEGSELAIRVMEVAREQNVFIPVKEALLDNQDAWASHGAPNTNQIFTIAASAGLDLDAAANQIKSPSLHGLLNQERADLKTVGIQQTPTFFVNGKPLIKFGADELKAQVRTEVDNYRNSKK